MTYNNYCRLSISALVFGADDKRDSGYGANDPLTAQLPSHSELGLTSFAILPLPTILTHLQALAS
ncbi:hypothetical protein PtB15_2B224 [Puccinia triticina]|nr:hypothetical protein PtB15_2B224 [Puccinia triticina]